MRHFEVFCWRSGKSINAFGPIVRSVCCNPPKSVGSWCAISRMRSRIPSVAIRERRPVARSRAAERRICAEYTGVIIKEADRLQTLVDRLLAPHRVPRIVDDVNIHEVCERVRSVVLAEFPVALPDSARLRRQLARVPGDKEQLIQALLNLVA